MSADARGTNIIRTVVAVIRSSRAFGKVRMRAGPGSVTNVIRTLVPIIRARGPGRLVVRQTSARPVTGIRVRTLIIRRITTGGAGRQIRMRTGTGSVTDIIGTVVAVIRARRAVGLVIVQTRTGAVARIGVGTIVVDRVATDRTGG